MPALNKNFKPKIVPVLNGLKSELLNNIQYPVCIQPIPRGIPIVIRSGFISLFTGTAVKNIELKGKLDKLIRYSRWLKVTLEAVISSKTIQDEQYIVSKLMDFSTNVDDIEISITDMIFERHPESIKYLVRARGMKNVLNPNKIGTFPKIVETNVANSQQEFMDYIIFYSVTGYDKFRIASPNSEYKFGEMEDLFSGDGGVIDIDGTELYKGELLHITPKVLTVQRRPVYLAENLTIRYKNNIDVEIPLKDISHILATKIWENRKALIGTTVVFSGLYVPGYLYPKFRNFIRFEK